MKKILCLIFFFQSCAALKEKGLLDPSSGLGLFIQMNLCSRLNICPAARPASETSREFTSFVFAVPPAIGLISDGKISAVVPFFSDRTKLKAGFTHNGSKVEMEGKLQESGVTENNFSKPVKYRVFAKDGNSRIYDVDVKNASANAKEIFQFGFINPDVTGFLTGSLNANVAIKILIAVPFGTPINNLRAKFITSGASINISGTPQVSGVTLNDFTNPIIYTVVAADNTTKTYEVTVQVGGTNTKDLLSFSFDSFGVIGSISGNSINVILPSGISPYNQISSFSSNGKIVKVSGNAQVSGVTPIDFSNPVIYTVEAFDGSTQNYTVTVIRASGSDKEITSFSIPSIGGTATITTSTNSGTIELRIPSGANTSNTIANFSISGLNTLINERAQISGQTFNNFNNPITYTVQASDGSKKNFLVTLTDSLSLTINGLNAAGLILFNGLSSSNVASGSTSIPIQLDASNGNRVSITAQPSGQVCAFSGNSAGILSEANPSSLVINCINGYLYAGKVLPYDPTGRQPMDTMVNFLFPVVGNASGTSGSADGTGTAASFFDPIDIEVIGNFAYVADLNNHTIRRIDLTTNAVTTLAGQAGVSGSSDGIGSAARFNKPHGISTDGANLYITDFTNHAVRKLDLSNNEVTTIAGTIGVSGFADGVGTAARFTEPSYSTYLDGNLYIADTNQGVAGAGKIRKLSLATRTVTTIATGLFQPRGITNDGTNLYVAEESNHLIRKIVITTGVMTVLAGSGTNASYDAIGTTAHLSTPYGIDIEGNFLYFSEATNNRLRKINLTTNRVETFYRAANGFAGGDTFTGTMNTPTSLFILRNSIYLTSRFSNKIFELKPAIVHRYYPLAGNGNEATNSGINGTLVGSPTPATNHNAVSLGALRFNGTSNYVQASDAGLPAGNSDRTMCAWINTENLPASNQHFVIGSYGSSGLGNNSFFSLFNNGGTQNIQIGSSIGGTCAAVQIGCAAISIPMNTWVHICGRLSGGNVNLYINGADIGPGTSKTFNTTVSGTLTAASLNDFTSFFKGKIADVRIYNRALSIGEILILATNIQDGLVVNFPFTANVTGTGQEDDIWFNRIDMTRNAAPPYNPNVIPLPGSFGKSVGFDGSTQSLSSTATTNLLPGGSSPRSLCAWVKPSVLPLGLTVKNFLSYGPSGNANCLALYNDNINPVRALYCTIGAGDLNSPYQVNSLTAFNVGVWYHMCGTYNGTTMSQYVNGSLIGSLSNTLNTITSPLIIGAQSPTPVYYFSGDIDEVRIYNRVLSLAEIRTLASPTKRMFLTASLSTGAMGGISGADSICNTDSARPDTEKVYKAFIVDGTNRRACNTANCTLASENIDWVLRPNTTYYQPYDSSSVLTNPNSYPVLTTNGAGILPIASTLLLNRLDNYIGVSGTNTWNGFATTDDWLSGTQHCTNWANTAGTGEIGYWGGTSNAIPNVNGLLNNGTLNCSIGRSLICVEQ
jgi:hypothetical protein